VQILIDNNRGERKPSCQTAVEITILRSKKELRYYRRTRDEFTNTISGPKKKWEDTENDE
jgi:hypothetical protein